MRPTVFAFILAAGCGTDNPAQTGSPSAALRPPSLAQDCSADEDCVATGRIPNGESACCPGCERRAATRASLDAFVAWCGDHTTSNECPEFNCARPGPTEARCVEGACVMDVESDPLDATTSTPVPPIPPIPEGAMTADSVAGRLARRLAQLSSGVSDPEAVRAVLPPGASWPLRLRGKRVHDIVVHDGADAIGVRLVLRDGSWEAAQGNSPEPSGSIVVQGVELTGPRGLHTPLSASPTMQRLGDHTQIHSEAPAGHVHTEPCDGALQVSSNDVYFEQGDASHGWYFARFDGPAPFHYTEAQRAALETALLEYTAALRAGPVDTQAHFRRHHGEPTAGVYDFGAGTIRVEADGVFVDAVGPLALPALFRANAVTHLASSFAHDVGDVLDPIQAEGFTLILSRYRLPGGQLMGSVDRLRVERFSIRGHTKQG